MVFRSSASDPSIEPVETREDAADACRIDVRYGTAETDAPAALVREILAISRRTYEIREAFGFRPLIETIALCEDARRGRVRFDSGLVTPVREGLLKRGVRAVLFD